MSPREPRVERAQQIVARDRVIDGEARDLSRGVHAGVGASSRDDRRVLADNRRKLVLDHGLDAEAVLLPLPA